MARKLQVVTDATMAAPTKQAKASQPVAMKDAVDQDERALLVAMRAKVGSTIDAGPPAHTLAPLLRQLREFDKEIRALDARNEDPAEASEPDGETADEAFDAEAL